LVSFIKPGLFFVVYSGYRDWITGKGESDELLSFALLITVFTVIGGFLGFFPVFDTTTLHACGSRCGRPAGTGTF
jgi:hypothetical protein